MSVVVAERDRNTFIPRLIAEGRRTGCGGVAVFGACKADGKIQEIEDVGFDDDDVGGINDRDVADIGTDGALGFRR